MKKAVLILLLFVYSASFAQQSKQWRAVYQYKHILSKKEKARRDSLIKAQPSMAEFMKKLYKKIDNHTYYLDFNQTTSVFKEKPKLDADKNVRYSGFKDRLLYKNLATKTYKDFRPVMSESFLVVDSLPDYHWQITGESKKIGNFNAIKAVGTEQVKHNGKEKTEEITAWFAPELPVGNGPQMYWGLPGLIIELHVGQAVYVLKELIANPKDKIDIKAPDKGKVVNREKFEKERKKIFEKMQKMYKNRRGEKSNGRHIRITM